MDKRKVIEKIEYTKILFDIFNSQSNNEFWRNIKEQCETLEDKKNGERERRLEQKNNYAKRKELTSLKFIKKEDKNYILDYEGIIKYIYFMCELKYKKDNLSYTLEEALKLYFHKIVNENKVFAYSLIEIFEAFITGNIIFSMRYIFDYANEKHFPLLFAVQDLTINFMINKGTKPMNELTESSLDMWLMIAANFKI